MSARPRAARDTVAVAAGDGDDDEACGVDFSWHDEGAPPPPPLPPEVMLVILGVPVPHTSRAAVNSARRCVTKGWRGAPAWLPEKSTFFMASTKIKGVSGTGLK